MAEYHNKQPVERFWMGCPIWFEKQMGEKECKLALRNVGWREITFVSLNVDGTTYQTDLSLLPEAVWEWKVSNTAISSFYPVLIRFADGVEWCNAGGDPGLPVEPAVAPDPQQLYYEEFTKAWKGTDHLCSPHVTQHYWRCGCGQINDIARTFCGKCRKEQQWVRDHLDGKTTHATDLQEQKLQEKKQKQAAWLKEQRCRKKKKILFWTALAGSGMALLTAVVLLLHFLMIPGRHYAVASAYMELDRFYEAYGEYRKAGSYGDSEQKLIEISRRISSETCISAGYRHTVRNNRLGKVDGTGYALDSQLLVSKWNSIRAVSAGKDHTLGLHYSGTVMAVGNEDTGALDVKNWLRVVAVGAGDGFSVGLQDDGKVLAVGKNDKGQCNVRDWEDITAISVGADFVLGLKSDGTVVAEGNNQYGQCDVSHWKDIILIAAGNSHALGLKSDGTVVAAGRNDHGACGVSDWTGIMTLAAGDEFTVGVKFDGTMVAVGKNDRSQINVEDTQNIISVTCGWDYTVAIQSDGTPLYFGTDEDGEGEILQWNLGF